MKMIFSRRFGQFATLWGFLAMSCAGAFSAIAADAPATQKTTIIGIKLVSMRSQSMQQKDGKPFRVNPGDVFEVVEVKDADNPTLDGNAILVKAKFHPMENEVLDSKFRALVNDGAIEFPDDLIASYLPLPPNAPDWLDDSSLTPKAKKGAPLETLQKAMESETEDWRTRCAVAIALQLRSETEPLALESLARATADSRREIRQIAANCIKRTRRVDLVDGREITYYGSRKPEIFASLAPILIEQLKKRPQQTSIVELICDGGPDVIPAVLKLIEPPYTQPIACTAASILVEFPAQVQEHSPLLWRAMAAGNDWALMAALNANLDGTLEKLTEQLQSNDLATRRRAAECLLKMGPLKKADFKEIPDTLENAVQALRKSMASPDPATARASVRALPWFGAMAKSALADLDKLAERKPDGVPVDEIQDATKRIRQFE